MRHLILLVLLATFSSPAVAAKRVTVAQLEKALASAQAAHKSDDDIAHKIGDMELTERLTEATRDRLNVSLEKGPQARLALQMLADQSAFLNPPAAELPATPVPDTAAQKKMLQAVQVYAAQTLPHLPNFLATRTINRFDDSPQALSKGGWPVHAGLHLVDTSSHEVSVRDERENQPPTTGSAVWKAQTGLISGGEFGTTLGMILADTAKGNMIWSHWEQTAMGQPAVFQYAVPRAVSHFEVMSAEEKASRVGLGSVTRGSRASSLGVQANDPSNNSIIHVRPGYHGSLWLDPATGTILRITIEAELKGNDPLQKADILVQYGPVQIGGKVFICPVRSLALSFSSINTQAINDDFPTKWLNETLFTNYHRFGSTVRVLPDADVPSSGNPPNGDSNTK